MHLSLNVLTCWLYGLLLYQFSVKIMVVRVTCPIDLVKLCQVKSLGPYGYVNLGQHWLRWWLVDSWHHAITWTSIDQSSVRYLWHSYEGNFRWKMQDICPWYEFENYWFMFTTTSQRGQWVKKYQCIFYNISCLSQGTQQVVHLSAIQSQIDVFNNNHRDIQNTLRDYRWVQVDFMMT